MFAGVFFYLFYLCDTNNSDTLKMKKIFLSILLSLFINLSFAADMYWGQTGHRATGEIATKHLSKKARKEVDKILGGKSLAFVSTYGDEIKSDSKYREFGPWHYVNLEPDQVKYDVALAAEEGDLLKALQKCKAVLQDKNSSREEKEFYLKMLVHFMGDLHQPFHVGRGEDKGGNDIQVRWFNQGSNIHRVWDSDMINSYQMSYTELAANTDELTAQKLREITSGDFETWVYESRALADKAYASVEIGEKLSYRYMYDWFPVVREQLQKGGIRLAHVLNEIYK